MSPTATNVYPSFIYGKATKGLCLPPNGHHYSSHHWLPMTTNGSQSSPMAITDQRWLPIVATLCWISNDITNAKKKIDASSILDRPDGCSMEAVQHGDGDQNSFDDAICAISPKLVEPIYPSYSIQYPTLSRMVPGIHQWSGKVQKHGRELSRNSWSNRIQSFRAWGR